MYLASFQSQKWVTTCLSIFAEWLTNETSQDLEFTSAVTHKTVMAAADQTTKKIRGDFRHETGSCAMSGKMFLRSLKFRLSSCRIRVGFVRVPCWTTHKIRVHHHRSHFKHPKTQKSNDSFFGDIFQHLRNISRFYLIIIYEFIFSIFRLNRFCVPGDSDGFSTKAWTASINQITASCVVLIYINRGHQWSDLVPIW